MGSKLRTLTMPTVLSFLGIWSLAGCGGSGANTNQPPPPSDPIPTITSISPSSAAAGGVAFTLTVTGANFIAGSLVNFGGAAPATTFVNSTQLTADIPAASIALPGTVPVTVINPGPVGRSNVVNFTIANGTNPLPTIDSVDLSCAPSGGQIFSLSVLGSNFVASSVVRLNGSNRATTFATSSELSAQIPASDIAAIGTAAVTVFNPPPGGGGSNSLNVSVGGASFPHSIAVEPTGRFAYVANEGCPDASVSMYTIKPATGILEPIGPPAATDFGAAVVTVDPLDRFAYVSSIRQDLTVGSVSAYTINSNDGVLTNTGEVSGACQPLCPFSATVDPLGNFAYVPNGVGPAPTSVSIFGINNTTGVFTSVGSTHVAGRAVSVSIHRSGNFAYVASAYPGDDVYMYTVDAATGALGSTGTVSLGSCVHCQGSLRMEIAMHPSGKYALVLADHCALDVFGGTLSIFSIDPSTGALTFIDLVPAGTCADSMAVDPLGKFVYATSPLDNTISTYSVNASGTLTLIGTMAAGSFPTSIAIHPSGKFAYVTNWGQNNVSMYSIDTTTGALTLLGTIGT